MAIRESEILGELMTATEKEIAANAWDENATGEAADPTGDRALEAMGEGLEGQHEEPDEEAEGEEAEGEEPEGEEAEAEGEDAEDKPKVAAKEAAAKAKPKMEEPEIPSRVPGHRLREQTEKTRVAEARATKAEADLAAAQATSKQEIAALNARLDGVLAAIQRTQQSAVKPVETAKPEDEMPEVLENPKGFAEYIVKTVQQALAPVNGQMADQRLETSFAIAHAIHKDAFEQAYGAIQKLDPANPEDRATVQRIRAARNPGEALVAWHKRNLTLAEVGDDPAAYRARLAQEARESLMKDPEFRKQILEDMRAEAAGANGGRPRHELRLPPSLNGAAGRGTSRDVVALDGSEQAVADAAWT